MGEALKERYINFFTAFGFKRLFGSEPTKVCLIDFLNSLLEGCEAPIKELSFRNEVFLSFFKAAEIAKLEPVERDAYEQSLKYYRDMKNVIDTAVEEKAAQVAREMSLALEEERRQKEEERRKKEEERRQKEVLIAKLKATGMSDTDIRKLLGA